MTDANKQTQASPGTIKDLLKIIMLQLLCAIVYLSEKEKKIYIQNFELLPRRLIDPYSIKLNLNITGDDQLFDNNNTKFTEIVIMK